MSLTVLDGSARGEHSQDHMAPRGESWTQLLVRSSRLVSEANDPAEILRLLVEETVGQMGARAAAVLRVSEGDCLRIAASAGLPSALASWETEPDLIGPELGAQLLAAAGPAFTSAHTIPLVSTGDLYGVLVLLADGEHPLAEDQLSVAAGFADLAATALGKAAQYAALAHSYAQLRASKEAMARSEKLRALGQMAAGVSHDLKNILNPLHLQLQLLRRRLPPASPAAEEVVGRMEEVVKYGVDVVERLREFSRQEPEREAEPVLLNAVLETTIDLCGPRVPAGANIELRREPGEAPAVLARRSELVTAIVNLMFNAIEAMPRGGTICVRTGAANGGGWIEVADDGPGMPPEIERRIFEPFFTTKEQGTGLGLAIVYAFVHRHSGELTVETAPGQGTRLRLWFPAA
jgi:signal transduction histidine kinase